MKIGILSMQKILNYGSFLQALSLKMQFEQRGHEVYFIDIIPGRKLFDEKPAKANLLKKFDRYFFKRIENFLLARKMATIHISDYEKYLDTCKYLPDDQRFDLVVIGSDEVFNATTPSGWGFTTQLFGDVKNADRVVTYAASCGNTTFGKANEYGITSEISKAMARVESISVRDVNTKDFVESITGRSAQLNVDPVFISDFDEFLPCVKRKKPYMLVYAYSNRICDKEEIKAIKSYAKEKDLDILCVGMQQRWCNNNIPASAFELLSYVKGAECVVTDTFHGTVFSIKYNKRFVSFVRDSNQNKLGGLLEQFELTQRGVDDMSRFGDVLDSPTDYSVVNGIIDRERQRSYAYLDMVTKAE